MEKEATEKTTLRNKSIGTKVSEEEYAALTGWRIHRVLMYAPHSSWHRVRAKGKRLSL